MTIDPVSLAITAGLTALQMGMQASRRIEGPRLTDLQVTVADYGTLLNYFKGLRRFEGEPIFWAEPLREEKRTRKTKGGKFNDYTYYFTGAALVADHEIDAVTRIWLDKHLIYDVTGAGPVTPFALSDGGKITDYIRIYLGTETQEADPTMLASVEAKEGVGSCPAYRGVSYVMFDGLPVEKFGNRVPQITIEAVTDAEPQYPYETVEVASNDADASTITFSPDGSRFLIAYGHAYRIWDTASRSTLIEGYFPVNTNGALAIADNGTIFALADGTLYTVAPDGLTMQGVAAETSHGDDIRLVVDGNGNQHVLVMPFSFFETLGVYTGGYFGGYVETDMSDIGDGSSWGPDSACVDSYGDVWVSGRIFGIGFVDDLFLYRVVDTGARPGSPGFVHINHGHANQFCRTDIAHRDGHFIVHWCGQRMFLIDDEAMTIVADVAIADNNGGGSRINFQNLPPSAETIWIGFSEISLTDLSTVRSVNSFDWVIDGTFRGPAYDRINNALISHPQFSNELTWRFLDRVAAATVTLADIVEDVAARCGVDPGDFDASDLDQEIDGYSWTQGDGKAILEPLLSAYDSAVRPHNFSVEFRKLGDTPSATLETEWFVREGDDPRYKVTITQDTDLPASITFNFADLDKDQQTNSIGSQRRADAVDTTREVTLDMTTLAITPNAARGLADRYFRRAWFARTGVENALTRQELALEPSDVRYLELDGITAGYRLLRLEVGANGVLSCRWVRDHPSLADQSGAQGAQMAGRHESVILVPLPSKAFVLDVPLLRDADAAVTPGLYHAAAPYAPGSWPGETLFQSLDGGLEYSTEKASVPSSAPSAWGVTTDELGDANPNLWDRGNSVNVRMQYGDLSSATEAAIDASPTLNLALLGNELIQFATATLEMDGTYTLTGLKRGRRGTEWAVADHSESEVFVLLDMTTIVVMGASDVGTDLYFKGVTEGRDATSAFPITFSFTGASLKPYAPTAIEAEKDAGTGDWSIEWIRRTRIGGAWTGGGAIPLSEASEEYALDIIDGMGAVVRTITGLATPAATYSAAQQSTDGGDVAEGDLHLRIYQISDTVGRGFAATADF